MHLLFFALYSALFIGLILNWRFFRFSGIKRRYFVAVFCLKLAAGIGLAQLYTDHYENRRTGDAYRFFDDAGYMRDSFDEDPAIFFKLFTGIGMEEDARAMEYYRRMTHMERPYHSGFINDNGTIIKANALVMFFSLKHYHVHTAFWCFFSMIGLTALYRLLHRYFPQKKWAMFLAVYLLPTVLFWSSGVLKEPLLILGMGLFLLGFFRFIYAEMSTGDYFKLFFGFLLMLFAKGYVLECMAPALAGLLLTKISGGRRFWFWFSLPHVLVLILIFIGPSIHKEMDVARILSLKQLAFYNVAEMSGSGSVISIPAIVYPIDVILNAPEAVLNTYLRPWPWDWSKAVYIPAALENVFLIFCIIIMLWHFRRPYGLSIPIIAFSLSFVLVLGVLTGEVVPIMGALVRYKLPSLIFLFVLIFACTDHVLLQRRFPFIRKIIRIL